MIEKKRGLANVLFFAAALIGCLFFMGNIHAATYYVSKEGGTHLAGSDTAPYDTWEKAALIPDTVLTYISTHVDTADTMYFDDDVFNVSSDYLYINKINQSDLIIEGGGATLDHGNVSYHGIYGTIADNVIIRNLTIIPPANKYALFQGPEGGATNWTFENCKFLSPDNHTVALIYWGDGEVDFTSCEFRHYALDDTLPYSILFIGTGSGTITNSIISPSLNYYVTGGIYSSSDGTLNIYNSVIMRTKSYGVQNIGTGIINISNSVINNDGVGRYCIRAGGSSVINTRNNYLIGSQFGALNWIIGSGITDENNIKTNNDPKFTSHGRVGYVMPNIDDTVNLNYALNVSDILAEYNFNGSTYFTSSSPWNSSDTITIRNMLLAGIMELGSHGLSHTDTTYKYALMINYTGTDTNPTFALTADRLLQLNTAEGNDNAAINTSDAEFDTLKEIIDATPQNWIITKSTTNGQDATHIIEEYVKASSLAAIETTLSPDNIVFNRSAYDVGFFKDEMLDPKTWFADTLINGDGNMSDPQTGNTYECRTYASPFTSWDNTSRNMSFDSGFILARTDGPVTSLNYFDMFDTRTFSAVTYLNSTTETETREKARALGIAAVESGLGLAILSHNAEQFSLEQWEWACDEWSKIDGLVVTSNQIFADTVRDSGLWTDNGDGTYSRTYENYTDYSLSYDSPLIDRGIDTGVPTDTIGNPIYGAPDIGAYEYQPPYSMGEDRINASGSIRIYSNGKYRYTNISSGTGVGLTVIPFAGWTPNDYSQYLDINISDWNLSGDYYKRWIETSLNSSAVVNHTIGDLKANTQYHVKVNEELWDTYTSNASGDISFVYDGGYSTKSFEIIEYTPPSPPSSGSSGGGGMFSQPWTRTFTPAATELIKGYTIGLKAKERVKLNVSNEEHYIGVTKITTTNATISIFPKENIYELNAGEEVKSDINDDDIYDVLVRLNSIENSQAEVYIQTIEESVSVSGNEQKSASDQGNTSTWLSRNKWSIGGITCCVIIITILIIKKWDSIKFYFYINQ